ncbi:NACHT domain- and WD repeat-containing protein 1-like [Eulemur rufifrons]|uniref:NACHT domain- and WD repeat-containing protein 1-like n=1 Tax=Eulemur rufifrons TaxID=859984 RepID=UPI00374424B6
MCLLSRLQGSLSGSCQKCWGAQVAPQPLWFSDTVANMRKLEELPYHLLHLGRWEELKQEVLGSMSWISCQGISGDTEDLLDDFDLCAPYLDCPEVSLVCEAL